MDDITRSNSLADLLSRRGEGIGRFQRINPIANQIAHAPQPAVWSADKERQRLPVAGDAERPLPDARRDVSGRPKG
jgi:hypothetical protein